MDIGYSRQDDGTDIFTIDPALSAKEKQTPGVLKQYAVARPRGRMASVSSIASCFYYVQDDTFIGDVVEELNVKTTILAIGIVDENGNATGIITRRELFNLLGRSFGEEAARGIPVSRIAKETQLFREDMNIVTVSEQITEEMKKPTLRFFLVTDSAGKFAGVFSTRDIMMFMSSVMRKDLDTAGLIQSRIVPSETALQKGDVMVAAATQMAMGAGGDFYSIKVFPDDRWFFMIADVSGKGMAASLLTSIVGGFIHMYDFSLGIKRFIKELNGYLFSTFMAEKFITSVFMTLDGRSGRLSIHDMGHSMIFLCRKGTFHNIKTGKDNLPLGIRADINPFSGGMKLLPGDVLLLVTDGVIEQCNGEKEEYGIVRCARLIEANRHMQPSQLVSLLKNDINTYRGEEQQYDDITFMLLRYR
jgi:sigma-B regulation protein RsbU (phosphoserine phosphatase)